jgi:hypothetical protein
MELVWYMHTFNQTVSIRPLFLGERRGAWRILNCAKVQFSDPGSRVDVNIAYKVLSSVILYYSNQCFSYCFSKFCEFSIPFRFVLPKCHMFSGFEQLSRSVTSFKHSEE